ncbi:MAG TPA: hypothetical protein VF491_01910, partial [Vicinamibacterales bacterium]
HMLGYFFDAESPELGEFLVSQQALRVSRLREIAARLAALNMPVDVDWLLLSASSRPGSTIGRPQLARELVRSGHVGSVQQAFDQWLATGRPAYVPRTGPSPAAVVATIHAAGGVASMAHPGVTKRDELIVPMIDSGLDALEVYHSDHRAEDVVEYRGMATRFNVLITGGSDFHGEEPPSTSGRAARPARPQRSTLGAIQLPRHDFEALEARARLRQGSGEAGAQS